MFDKDLFKIEQFFFNNHLKIRKIHG